MAPEAGPQTVESAATELLSSVRSEACGAEVREALYRAALQLLRSLRPSTNGLSTEDRDYLIQSGVFTKESLEATETQVARGELREEEARTSLQTIAASLAASEVASCLGVSLEEVHRRRESGELYGFDAAGVTVFPKWQFTGGEWPTMRTLPGLKRVLSALINDWHPASVEGFMTSPQDGLEDQGERQTPIGWMLHGGDPSRIEAITEGVRSR